MAGAKPRIRVPSLSLPPRPSLSVMHSDFPLPVSSSATPLRWACATLSNDRQTWPTGQRSTPTAPRAALRFSWTKARPQIPASIASGFCPILKEQTTMHEAPLFTVYDHLRVQQQIEERAHELWHAGGCCDQSAMSDWLQAEREVLAQFVLAYALQGSAPREPSRSPAAEAKPRRPETTTPSRRTST